MSGRASAILPDRTVLWAPPCAICGGDEYEPRLSNCRDRLLGLPGVFTVVRCRRCSLLATRPQPTREAIGDWYPPEYAATAYSGTRSPTARMILSTLRQPRRMIRRPPAREPSPTPGARLLDVGCGNGSFLESMARRGWDVSGIEPTDVRTVAPELERRVERRRLEDVDFPAGCFQLVTLWHVLEHLHEPRQALEHIRPWLAADGRLRIAVPNASCLDARVFRSRWFSLDVPRHLHHFTPQTLHALLEKSGYRVERILPEFETISLPASMARLLVPHPGRRRDTATIALQSVLLPISALRSAFGSGASIEAVARPFPSRG